MDYYADMEEQKQTLKLNANPWGSFNKNMDKKWVIETTPERWFLDDDR